MPRGSLLAQDIPYRKGKVGARKTSPRRRIIKAPYLYDIQENHTRLGLPRDIFIITFQRPKM